MEATKLSPAERKLRILDALVAYSEEGDLHGQLAARGVPWAYFFELRRRDPEIQDAHKAAKEAVSHRFDGLAVHSAKHEADVKRARLLAEVYHRAAALINPNEFGERRHVVHDVTINLLGSRVLDARHVLDVTPTRYLDVTPDAQDVVIPAIYDQRATDRLSADRPSNGTPGSECPDIFAE